MAKILHEGRLVAGYTQKEMGQKMGISQSALSKMEAGKLEPSAIQWMRFARFTKTKVEALMQLIEEYDQHEVEG